MIITDADEYYVCPYNKRYDQLYSPSGRQIQRYVMLRYVMLGPYI